LVKIATGNRVYVTFLSVNYNSNKKLELLSCADTLLGEEHIAYLQCGIALVTNQIGFNNNYVILGKIFYSSNLIARYCIVNYL
jgi:hypothetical protein